MYTHQAGRTPALQQNWQKNHKILRKNTIFNEHPVIVRPKQFAAAEHPKTAAAAAKHPETAAQPPEEDQLPAPAWIQSWENRSQGMDNNWNFLLNSLLDKTRMQRI